jgi:hypothetical protein
VPVDYAILSTLDILFTACFMLQRIADDLSGAANDATQATDRLLWAVNAFGQSLAEVWCLLLEAGGAALQPAVCALRYVRSSGALAAGDGVYQRYACLDWAISKRPQETTSCAAVAAAAYLAVPAGVHHPHAAVAPDGCMWHATSEEP